MSACGLRLTVVLVVLVALLPAPAAASRDAGVAALQVALRARGLYAGSIDGLKGPLTSAATKRFQRRAGLAPSGFTGTNTRKALGR
ncbi:MAG TPA: peptidoglycan-binding domain-containing protein, partial [Gaiellaceae bacterium]|nr:peptidoglycan-binding domain-containing protein [Gaiellaceae bacterium]